MKYAFYENGLRNVLEIKNYHNHWNVFQKFDKCQEIVDQNVHFLLKILIFFLNILESILQISKKLYSIQVKAYVNGFYE